MAPCAWQNRLTGTQTIDTIQLQQLQCHSIPDAHSSVALSPCSSNLALQALPEGHSLLQYAGFGTAAVYLHRFEWTMLRLTTKHLAGCLSHLKVVRYGFKQSWQVLQVAQTK